MANSISISLPLFERIPMHVSKRRIVNAIILFLHLSFLAHRLLSLNTHAFTWLLAFFCEFCFTIRLVLYLSTVWTPVSYQTYPQRLLQQVCELPKVDMFVTTTDPIGEPAILTVNTVLSLLAVEYPTQKLACYVSDDGCSPLTYYALLQASKFATLWLPFCKKHSIQLRAPFRYFSSLNPSSSEASNLPTQFQKEHNKMKDEYDDLCWKIENAAQMMASPDLSDDFEIFKGIEPSNHPTIIKVISENKEVHSRGLPHLIYIAREKRPNTPHHYKAGAMNVLTRISGVMTNASYMLNVDCDMYANNPQVVMHAMCLLLDLKNEEQFAFVQFPQLFYDQPKDDPFGNVVQVVMAHETTGRGLGSLQGSFYKGTGCFHRRKIIYGLSPYATENKGILTNETPREEVFGDSKEFIKSVAETFSCVEEKKKLCPQDLRNCIEGGNYVSRSSYEQKTSWGIKVGWQYGSTAEDILTGMRIQARGWKSAFMMPHPPAFLGCAPSYGPIFLIQKKRWATGLMEILFSKHNPIFYTFSSKLQFRQCLAYLWFLIRPLISFPHLCYTILPAYCILTNTSFLPKIDEPAAMIPVALFLIQNLQAQVLCLQHGLSIPKWWNNKRMEKINYTSGMLYGAVTVIPKLLGLSESIFEVTQKNQSSSNDSEKNISDASRFTFNESPVFVVPTTIVFIQLMALVMKLVGLQPPAYGGGGSGLGEILSCIWQVLCLWPFVKGLFGQGKFGIPFITICKSVGLALLFVHLSISVASMG